MIRELLRRWLGVETVPFYRCPFCRGLFTPDNYLSPFHPCSKLNPGSVIDTLRLTFHNGPLFVWQPPRSRSAAHDEPAPSHDKHLDYGPPPHLYGKWGGGSQ